MNTDKNPDFRSVSICGTCLVVMLGGVKTKDVLSLA